MAPDTNTDEGRSRVYYALSTAGLKCYGDLAHNWTVLTVAIQSVIGGSRRAAIT